MICILYARNIIRCLSLGTVKLLYLEILIILHLDALELKDQKGSPFRGRLGLLEEIQFQKSFG